MSPPSEIWPVLSTVGLHGSASTWVFNVIRELVLDAVGEERTLAFYAEELSRLPEPGSRIGRHLVIKSHHGGAELDAWMEDARAVHVISVRDPRDAAISMARRFNAPLGQTVRWLARDCQRLERLCSQDKTLLRYEDRFFDDVESVARLARLIGHSPTPTTIGAIFARYRTEAVRAFARNLPAPSGAGSFSVDAATQIHRAHIGDARGGKWRELPNADQVWITEIFAPFLCRFGYFPDRP